MAAEEREERHKVTIPRENWAGWPRVIAHPGLPQIRTCRTTASGSSGDSFASRSTHGVDGGHVR